ncbi:MAG TPA: type 4a pilus biogenesis protein PilO, partial [Steroidobacteraceae bacterium]|nr:type 4a pilus biogenesis protein PilO [Steroidobacteraceae bacterium]
VSGVAALPRIVTLHDVQITQVAKNPGADELQLDVTAKTYRYLDEEEQAAAKPAKQGPAGKKPNRPAAKPAT